MFVAIGAPALRSPDATKISCETERQSSFTKAAPPFGPVWGGGVRDASCSLGQVEEGYVAVLLLENWVPGYPF